MGRFLFFALFISLALGQQQRVWTPVSDYDITKGINWNSGSGSVPIGNPVYVFLENTTMEFPAGHNGVWGGLEKAQGELIMIMNTGTSLSFTGLTSYSVIASLLKLDIYGPASIDTTKIKASNAWFNFQLTELSLSGDNFTMILLGALVVPMDLLIGAGNSPQINYGADFRSANPMNETLPDENSWVLDRFEVADGTGPAGINIERVAVATVPYVRSCSCTTYFDCCVLNFTLSGPGDVNRVFDLNYDATFIRLNFISTSTSDTALHKDLTFDSATLLLDGIWNIDSGIKISATALPIPALGASATRAEIIGTINGLGRVEASNYDTLAVRSGAVLASTVIYTGNQVEFYGTQLEEGVLDLDAPTMAAYLDETDVVIGSLILRSSMALTLGSIRAKILTATGLTINIASGASLRVDSFATPVTIVFQSFSSILAVSNLGTLSQAILQGDVSLLLVESNFVGESVPETYPLRIGELATLTYASETNITRRLELFGGTLRFDAPNVTVSHLTARLRNNATLSGGIVNIEYLAFSSPRVVTKALVIDVGTTLNLVGTMNISLPAGSTATIGGAGLLDASGGNIEIWSGKLVIQSDFVGSVTVRGGSVEFYTETQSTSQNITTVYVNGGNVEAELSAYTLPLLYWNAGSINAPRTLTVDRLVVFGGGSKSLTDFTVLNITAIEFEGDTSVSFDASSTATINNIGNFTLPSGVFLNGGSVLFKNCRNVVISSGAELKVGNYDNVAVVPTGGNLRRSIEQSGSEVPLTVIDRGTITGDVLNGAIMQANGNINGRLHNLGEVYLGDPTDVSPGQNRRLVVNGAYDQSTTSTITPLLYLSVAGLAPADTDMLQANQVTLGGNLTLYFAISTTGVDQLSAWVILTTPEVVDDTIFANINSSTFEGEGRLVFTTTGAQWEFVGCHNQKSSCKDCLRQTFSTGGCDWCKIGEGFCRASGTCQSDAVNTITVGEEGQCPDADENPLLYLIFIPGGLILAGGIVVLIVFLKRRNRVGGSADAALLKKKPGPPEFLPIAFGPSMMESKLSKKDKDLVPALERLKDLLLAEDMELVMTLTDNDIIKAVDLDKFCQALTYVFESVGRYPHLLNALVDREVELHHSDEASLLRGNTVATISWKFYSKLVGLEYLWNTLSDGIYLLVEKTSAGEISTEMDPVLMGEEEDGKVNKYQLMLTAQQILSRITKSVEHVPLPMKFICHHLQERVMAKYPSMRYTSVGGFIFLRFLNPAINLPEAYGLTRKVPSKEARRVFVLITKTLQSLANAIKLGGKEQHMAKLNDFIDENQTEINTFFEQCAILPEGASESDLKPVDIPHHILLVCMAEIHRQIHYSIMKLKEKLPKEKFEQLSGIMNEIGGPIKIENSTSKSDNKVDSLLAGLK